MALNRVQHVRHDKAGADAFLGRLAELTVDSTTPEVRLHDGIVAGGRGLALATLTNAPAATTGNDGKMTTVQVVQLTDHESRITVNEADIAQNEIDITANAAQIATNVTDIADKISKVPSPVLNNAVKQTADGSLADAGFAPVQMNEGTKAIFPQAAAPDGWTLDATHNDRILRINDTAGGGTSGNWVITGGSVDGHQLTLNEMAAHLHKLFADDESTNTDIISLPNTEVGWRWNPAGDEFAEYRMKARNEAGMVGNSEVVGGNAVHDHGLTFDGTWRPAVLDALVCIRNAIT